MADLRPLKLKNCTEFSHIARACVEQTILKSFEKTHIGLNLDTFHSLCSENDVTERKASRIQRQRRAICQLLL